MRRTAHAGTPRASVPYNSDASTDARNSLPLVRADNLARSVRLIRLANMTLALAMRLFNSRSYPPSDSK
eukprot:8296226-Alexandrium_andersonii.AAC.1